MISLVDAQALESTGAKAFATPAEAVRGAKFVHLVLTDDTVVDSVLEGFIYSPIGMFIVSLLV